MHAEGEAGVTRHGLNRGMVGRIVLLATLAVFIGAVYSGVVFGLGTLLGADRSSTPLSVLAMTIVALTFGRVRVRAQRLADRIARGERATPYEVLSGLAELVARPHRHEDVLFRVAELAASGTGAARVGIWLRVGPELLLGARWPHGADRMIRLPLPDEGLPAIDADRVVAVRDGGELLGAIDATKRPGDVLTSGEARLLEDVASQAGLVLKNVRLTAELRARLDDLSAVTAELRASRRRIVETQDQERRRLERDIHDGAQQHLVALAVKLRMARTMADRDPERSRRMVGEVHGLTDAALANLRDLTRGIYPPALVEHGVAAALREHVRRAGASVEVTAEGTERADAQLEAAAYFACLEAIQNAAKHAAAKRVRVRLEQRGGSLIFSVSDDGAGFNPDAAVRGSGLENMSDRLGAVGGTLEIRSSPGQGTTVTGRIPLRAVEVHA